MYKIGSKADFCSKIGSKVFFFIKLAPRGRFFYQIGFFLKIEEFLGMGIPRKVILYTPGMEFTNGGR